MAVIRPFKGLRFQFEKAGQPEQLTCPPYDIISEEQRLNYISENQYNIIRLELPKGDSPYEQAGNILNDWLENGILDKDETESLYLYEQVFCVFDKTYSNRGLISRVELAEFSEGIVLPHEETLSKAKNDRFELMKSTFCNFSQIYSLYFDAEKTVSNLLDKISSATANIEFTDEVKVTHRLWNIDNKQLISDLIKNFADKKLYIADGHHRYETALNFRNLIKEKMTVEGDHPANQVMMFLADIKSEGLIVFPTHRLIHGLKQFDSESLLAACKKYFEVEEYSSCDIMDKVLNQEYCAGNKSFGFYNGGEEWYLLRLHDVNAMSEFLPQKSQAYCGLDVAILHTLILEKLMGIDAANLSNQTNLTYTRDFREAINVVKMNKFQAAFILNPTRVTEIAAVAAAGEKMPQKSTYFYPKLITGLIMNQIKDIRNNIFE